MSLDVLSVLNKKGFQFPKSNPGAVEEPRHLPAAHSSCSWSMTSLPRAIAADQVQQLLASINRRTAMGCRDYAILLLLARLGLRASEVAFRIPENPVPENSCREYPKIRFYAAPSPHLCHTPEKNRVQFS